MSESNEKIKHLVADTTAFINAVPLQEYAEKIYTVPDVMAEVRNKRQIRRLCVLPYELQVLEPSPESVKHCLEFSKKTGDYASLSGIDMKIIALTYELETKHVGQDHLRSVPLVSKLVASKEKPIEFQVNDRLPGWFHRKKKNRNDDCSSTVDGSDWCSNQDQEEEEEVEEEGGSVSQPAGDNEEEANDDDEFFECKIDPEAKHYDDINNTDHSLPEDFPEEYTESELEEDDVLTNDYLEKSQQEYEKLQELFREFELSPIEHDEDAAGEMDSANEEENCDPLVPVDKEHPTAAEDSATESSEEQEDEDEEEQEDDEEDDDDSWITPSNVNIIKRTYMNGNGLDTSAPTVACMSTDFAIQNTLRQMNLKVAALNGCVIRQTRTFILRCYTCFKTTSIMSKQFCPNCGHKTLKKVAVSVDETGKQVIHISTRRPLTTKYKNQSIPLFRGGKHSNNPILFEDQPMPRQMPSRVAKTKTNALDEDYTAGFSPFAQRDTQSKSAILRSKGQLSKDWSRNTRYEEERRRRHYNRLYK